MNQKISDLINISKKFLSKHSPEILTGIGLTGMITSTILAVKATPKALTLIDKKKKELQTDELTPLELIKTTWKPYLPTVGTIIMSSSCIIFASRVNYKRNAALATAYSISERTLLRYRDKVIETIGENKERSIREYIAQDDVNDNKKKDSQIIVTSKGNTLFMDSMSGRYFKSDIDQIKKVVNELNRKLVYENYISLNEFYGEIGLDHVKNGNLVGWNINSGLIEPDFSTCLTDDDQPCVVLDFFVTPKYDYDKLI